MKLLKVVGMAFAAAALAAWLGAGQAVAKPAYKTATGKACKDCHDGAPKNKKLTPAGKKFKECFDKKKDAKKCK
jgi:hypothetical protein